MSIDALPVILPIHFAVGDDSVLIQTVRDTKLDLAAAHSVVAFQADTPEPEGGWWSVLLQGIANPVGDDELRKWAGSLTPWPGSDARSPTRMLRIGTGAMRGWSFGAIDMRLQSGQGST